VTGPCVLVVDDVPENIGVLVDCLRREGCRVLVAQDGRSALDRAVNGRPDVVLLDVMLPGMDGYEVCRRLQSDERTAEIPVIFLTALDDTQDKIRAFSTGAVDYLTKPFQYEEVVARVNTHVALRRSRSELAAAKEQLEARVRERTAELERALAEVERLKERLEDENRYLKTELSEGRRDIVGASPAIVQLLAQIDRVAAADSTVLVFGETGAGKELVARAVHERSRRREKPLVMLNCAAISAGLVENELFGHVKGAYTGATERHVGRFALADGGTLFLDEVSELPPETQVKLLRVLQEREFEPVGSSRTQKVDVRVVAATNRDLPKEVRDGRFRADLYYRLNVFPIRVPPLRERLADLPLLVEHFVGLLSRRLGQRVPAVSAHDLALLARHRWPGNVRELANTIERAMVMSTDGALSLDWFEPDTADEGPAVDGRAAEAPLPSPAAVGTEPEAGSLRLADVQRDHILALLRQTRGTIEGPRGVAKLLDMKPSTVRHRIRKLGIRKSEYLD
jgi:formate hydrogenlyase transcriptional activator